MKIILLDFHHTAMQHSHWSEDSLFDLQLKWTLPFNTNVNKIFYAKYLTTNQGR